jgi:hypothetical protein
LEILFFEAVSCTENAQNKIFTATPFQSTLCAKQTQDELGVVIDNRVARWFVFKPKIPIWVNFGACCDGSDGIFYGHLVYVFYGHLAYFPGFWYILRQCGMGILPVLVSCRKKNLATLIDNSYA